MNNPSVVFFIMNDMINSDVAIAVGDLLKDITPTQRRFLGMRLFVDNDHQCCKQMGIAHVNPIKWRKTNPAFRQLEQMMFSNVLELVGQLSDENMLLSVIVQQKVMLDDKATTNAKLQAAKDAQALGMRVRELLGKKQKPFEIRMIHDSGESLQPAQDAGDSPPVESP